MPINVGMVANVLIVVIGLLLVVTLLRRLTRDTSYARAMFFTHLAFVATIGWGLVIASAVFNMLYTYTLLSSMPSYENLASLGAGFAVAVNLAGGLALQAAAKSFNKSKYVKGVGYAVMYAPILMYSLLAANSILLTGDAHTRQKADTALADQAAKNQKIKAFNADIAALRSGATNLALAEVPSTMLNSNGKRVSVSAYCKAGNWYHKNRTTCRDYIDAKNQSGASTEIAKNEHAKADLEEQIAQSKATAPVPLQSSFFGLSVPSSIATLALALAMELAAVVSLIYVTIDIGNPPPLPSRKKSKDSQSGSRSKGPKSRSANVGGLSGSGSPASAGGVVDNVNEGSDPDADQGIPRYYKGGKFAANHVFGDRQVTSVTADQLHGFLYELAKANPHKPVVADQVIKELRDRIGCGVGKQRVLQVIKDSSEFVLTKDQGGSNTYIFKMVNDETTSTENLVSAVSAAQGSGPRRSMY